MANMNIDDNVYTKWKKFYDKHDKMEFPTIKNFTEKKMLHLMSIHEIN